MKLFESPWSHNCAKVRLALDHKGLDHEVHAFNGVNRLPVKRGHESLRRRSREALAQ